MIHISDSAKQQLIKLRQDEGLDDDYFVKVVVKGGGCSGFTYDLSFDNDITDSDEVFEDNGIKIVTNKPSLLYLIGTILDFSDGLNGKGFTFSNPNATRTCGCGESFAV